VAARGVHGFNEEPVAMKKRLAAILAGVVMMTLVGAVGTHAAEPVKGAAPDSCLDETSSEVPALSAFHEVIYPLWHEAWPNKNYAMMKELLPEAQRHVTALQTVTLPGILRDKSDAWGSGIKVLATTLKQYETAAAKNDEPGLLNAVESLHSIYEDLVRVVRPPMKELEAYHVELYKIYHHALPDKNWDDLTVGAALMAERCKELLAAPVPKRFADQEKSLHQELSLLSWRTKILNEACAAKNWFDAPEAVENVHTQYQKIAEMLAGGAGSR
jgi:hypothetical protein